MSRVLGETLLRVGFGARRLWSYESSRVSWLSKPRNSKLELGTESRLPTPQTPKLSPLPTRTFQFRFSFQHFLKGFRVEGFGFYSSGASCVVISRLPWALSLGGWGGGG